MVLNFKHTVTLSGGSADLREACFTEIIEEGWTLTLSEYEESSESDSMGLKTSVGPLDDKLLELAAKYLALDFEVNFEPMEDTVLGDWKGCIKIEDQEVFFTDNYEASDTLSLGSIYELQAKGGIAHCLANYQS